MLQFKPYFTGETSPPNRRLTSAQKCFRVSDIDEVGDSSHLTFFEMLGNFSIGDYFKKDAIGWAWEFVTEHMGLPPERLYATVFQDDDEAHQLWESIGIPAERIWRFGETDNYWGPAGNEGPCGPCSEIHYDFGGKCRVGKADPECGPNCECGRFLELWNLVFMQFYQDANGERTTLPNPNIDTGMGLERAVSILQNAKSVYDTDIFAPIIQRVAELAGKSYGDEEKTDVAIRVVGEHSRSAAFLIADGVVPSNEGRGYVLRKVIRRALFYSTRYLNSLTDLPYIADAVVDTMGAHYKELLDNKTYIKTMLAKETDSFLATLNTGTKIIEQAIVDMSTVFQSHLQGSNWQTVLHTPLEDLWSSTDVPRILHSALLTPLKNMVSDLGVVTEVNENQRKQLIETTRLISGQAAFILYDTYGFPCELTAEIGRQHGLEVDMEGFRLEMDAQQERSRAASGFAGGSGATRAYQEMGAENSRFLGYDATTTHSEVVGLLVDGVSVDHAQTGQKIEILLNETPFYPEGGGQVGDIGSLLGASVEIQIDDTQSPITGLIVHHGKVTNGVVSLNESVVATVEPQHRMDAARNHTATHLLHAALRQILGLHVRQQGSLVTPGRLRFDFTHINPLSKEELQTVEKLVNDRIRANLKVRHNQTTYRQAVAQGALAFFGERYGDQVRVVEVANGDVFSFEVCGGTHVKATGDIGYCHIVGESSIGAGLRRIEAVTGHTAETLVTRQLSLLDRLAHQLEVAPQDLEAKVASLVGEVTSLRREASKHERSSSREQASDLLEQALEIDGFKVVYGKTAASTTEGLRDIGDWIRDKLGSSVIILGAVVRERPLLLVMISSDLVSRGFHAGNIAREAAKTMGGGGGGRPEMAQAGGRNINKLMDALQVAVDAVKKQSNQI
ncbi:alanine--tRNA ligase [Dehalococcoidia bacterium]|nr:alanine--tRNA ligase [Dehalococcoidia bacterium]